MAASPRFSMRTGILVLALASACGPVISTDDASSSTTGPSSTSSDDDSASTPATLTTSPPPPTTADPSDPISTSTATFTSTTDGSSTSDSGATFISDPTDGGVGCAGGNDGGVAFRCSLWEQDCCSGEKCMPWANDGGEMWNSSRCSPVDPKPRQIGDPCIVEGSAVSGIDNCDEGLMCWSVNPKTNEGSCVELCNPYEPAFACLDIGTVCMNANDGQLPICVPSCDPLDPQACEGSMCIPSGQHFVCVPPGTEVLPEGIDCTFPTSCTPGSTCVPPDFLTGCNDDLCCTPYCDLDQPACDAGLICQPWYEAGQAPEGLENVGVCVSG